MKYRPVLLTVFGLTTTLLLIGFANIDNNRRVCNKVMISIDNQLNNHFIDDNDVMSLLSNNNKEVIEGAAFADLNVRALENRVNDNSYVQDAEIFRDLKGNLLVNVMLRRPVARVIEGNGRETYIAEDGTILPVSDKFSSRVLVISGVDCDSINALDNIKTKKYADLFKLINFINQNKFWRAQIAQIDIQKQGEVTLLPQVTKQNIEFGDFNNIEDKFSRLAIFYKDILPRKGWNSYKKVNVKYKDQIICE